MIINHSNVQSLFISYRRTFENALKLIGPGALDGLATTVPATTSRTELPFLGLALGMEEWIDERVARSIGTHKYAFEDKEWHQTIALERKIIEDDQYGAYSTVVQQMGAAAGLHKTELLADLLNNARQNVPASYGYDGVPFISATHPVRGLAAQSNINSSGSGPWWYVADVSQPVKPLIWGPRRPIKFVSKTSLTDDSVFYKRTFVMGNDARYNGAYGLWQQIYGSNQTLDATNLEAILIAMTTRRGENNKPLNIRPSHLIVPPALRFTAERLIGLPFVSGDVQNIHHNRLQVVSSPYLTAA